MSPRQTLPLARTAEERKLVDRFAEQGLSQTTIKLYVSVVRRADRWAGDNGYRLRTLPTRALVEYAETLPRSWSSRCRLRSALSAYWKAVKRPDAPLSAIRVQRSLT